MYRNLTGASSALAMLALLAGAPMTGFAHEDSNLCNVILDGDGEPVREADSDDIAHGNTYECPDDAAAVENTEVEQPTAAAIEAPAAVVEPLVVYFDVNENSLDAGTKAAVDAYVQTLMATSPRSLNVVGYTDTSGSAALNKRLSEERAANVATALVNAGVPSGMITSGASGEGNLAVVTPDGTREASNRRVAITPSY